MEALRATHLDSLKFSKFGPRIAKRQDVNGPLPIEDKAFDQIFASKILVDLFASVRITNQISFTVSVNNLFNVYPDVIDTKGEFVTDLGGRFKYPWEVNQFGFNGRILIASVNINL